MPLKAGWRVKRLGADKPALSRDSPPPGYTRAMEISLPVLLVVLAGALLHAAWNAMLKAADDKHLDTTATNLARGIVAAAVLPFLPAPARESWPWILASAAVHVAYFQLLAEAYRHGDMSFTYPVMRGGGPVVAALASLLLFGERLEATQAVALVLICAGILGFVSAPGRERAALRRPLTFALANAAVIGAYTLIDAQGVRASGAALSYVLWFFVVNGFVQGGYGVVKRGRAALAYASAHWMRALAGALCSMGAYGSALWAMTLAPVALVAGLRETSVVFGALLGAIFLGERFTRRRVLATATVLAGLVVLRL